MSVRLDQRDRRLGELRARRAILAMNGVRPRRRRRARRQQEPRGERLAFQRAILEILAETEERIAGEVLPSLERFAEQQRQTDPSTRLDAPIDEIRALIERLRGAVQTNQLAARIRALVARMAERVSAFNRRELDSIFSATVGVGLPPLEPFLADTIAAAVSENVRRVTNLVTMQFDQLETTIASGFRRGLRHTEIATQIQERLGVARSRARLIARDQVASLNGELTRQRQTNLGVREYIWRTSGDERVRPSHEALEGRRFRWDEPPDEGHPGEPINCFPGDTLIAIPDGPVRFFRRWYEGPLVVVETETGSLRCTPNHPILTGNGWRMAEELHEGDHVVQASLDPTGVGNDHDYQTTLGELWDLACSVGLRYRRRGWFHGDVSPDEQVDVVHVYGDLSPDRPALCAECLEQLALAQADEAGLGAGLFQQSRARSRRAAHRVVSSGRAGGALRAGEAPVHCEHCRGAIPRFTATLDEPPRDDSSRNVELGGQRLDRLPLGVAFHQLSEPSGRVEFRGHVYNLESVGHWYVAAAVVVHNCRCVAEPVLDELIEAT